MLDELTPKQQALLDTYREAEVTGYTKGMEQAAAQLEEEGVDMKAVAGEHLEDETPKTGPPDPAVAAKKMAEGYVWHEETRHWIKKDSLDELHGMNSGHDASLVSASHGGDKPFGLNESGAIGDGHYQPDFFGYGYRVALRFKTGGVGEVFVLPNCCITEHTVTVGADSSQEESLTFVSYVNPIITDGTSDTAQQNALVANADGM